MIILTIDDDGDDRELLREAISIIDRNIICVQLKDGVDALHYLESDLELPDLIFLDINMPRMNGIACLEILRANPKFDATRIIIFSTSRDAYDVQKAKVLGSDFFTKPNSFADLVILLRSLLAQQTT